MEDKAALLRSLTVNRDPVPQPPGWDPRLVMAGGGGVIALILIAVWLAWPDAAPAPAAAAPSAASAQSTAAPAPKPAAAGQLVASGYVVARRKATIAAETTGKVVEVLIEEGMTVEAGQVLARLDGTLAELDAANTKARVAVAEAALAAVRADLADAERIAARAGNLAKSNVSSDAERTRAEARAAVLRAQTKRSEAELTSARLDADRSRAAADKLSIKAPFAGVVVDKAAQPGEMISPLSAGGGFTRTGICTIVDMESLEIEVDVNEAFINRIKAGQRVAAVLDAYPDAELPAYVVAIVPTANREKATVRVRIGFTARDPRVLPDMAAKVTFYDDKPKNG